MKISRLALRALGALVLAAAAFHVHAQSYPSKPITLIVPYGPGGAGDALARTVAEQLQARLGQPVVVDNKPGGSTVVSSNITRLAQPDGYTLYMATSQWGRMPLISPSSAKYDPMQDFTPIGQISGASMVLVANNNVPFNDVKGMVAYAKANPGKLAAATTGNGSTDHMAFELLANRTGTKYNFIPYKSAAPALQDLLGGVVNVRIDGLASSRPLIEAGKIKVFGVFDPTRSVALPNVPTMGEAVPGLSIAAYFGLVGPKGLPKDVVARLSRELLEVMKMPEVVTKLVGLGLDPVPTNPEQFAGLIRQDNEMWAKLLKEGGIKLDE